MALSDNLLSYWKFDTDPNDSVGSNDGTVTSATLTTGDGGKVDECYNYGGLSTGKYIVFGDPVIDTTSTDWSVNIWGNMEDDSGDNFFISNADSDFNNGFMMYWRSTRTVIKVDNSNMIPTHTFNEGTWYMHTLTFNQSSNLISYYIDGTFKQSATLTPGTATQDLVVGTMHPSNNRVCSGLYDELGVWDKILTTDEITDLYNSGSGLQYPFGEEPREDADNAIFHSHNF